MTISQTGCPTAPGVLTIDLTALKQNWLALARLAAPAGCAAVVKANAYGVGTAAAARTLYAAGCRVFFVAHVQEGRAARHALGADADIYVLNGLEPRADVDADYVASGLAPVIGSTDELARWSRAALLRGAPAPCALHLDTGMNRLGFANLGDLTEAMERFGAASGARLLISHFVSSEAPDDPINALQVLRFEAARKAFPNLPASIANSSGLFLPSRPHGDLVRPGYALYGGNPTPPAPNPMRTVVRLAIAIQQTRWIEAGDSCGYNAQWIAKRRTRLATVLAGYADGLPRGAGAVQGRPGAEVVAGGRRCALVGRISMDTCIVDVTDAPEERTRPGDAVEFLGDSISVDDLATRSGTIGYQILTSLGARYRRDYLG